MGNSDDSKPFITARMLQTVGILTLAGAVAGACAGLFIGQDLPDPTSGSVLLGDRDGSLGILPGAFAGILVGFVLFCMDYWAKIKHRLCPTKWMGCWLVLIIGIIAGVSVERSLPSSYGVDYFGGAIIPGPTLRDLAYTGTKTGIVCGLVCGVIVALISVRTLSMVAISLVVSVCGGVLSVAIYYLTSVLTAALVVMSGMSLSHYDGHRLVSGGHINAAWASVLLGISPLLLLEIPLMMNLERIEKISNRSRRQTLNDRCEVCLLIIGLLVIICLCNSVAVCANITKQAYTTQWTETIKNQQLLIRTKQEVGHGGEYNGYPLSSALEIGRTYGWRIRFALGGGMAVFIMSSLSWLLTRLRHAEDNK